MSRTTCHLNDGPRMRLTVTLTDGRVLSGVYDWLGALARLGFAKTLPNFCDFTLTEAP